MKPLIATLIFCAATVSSLFWLTQEPELRGRRWKLIPSVPLAFIIGYPVCSGLLGDTQLSHGYIAVFFCIVGFGILWASEISWKCSGSFVSFLQGDARYYSSSRPEFRFARSHKRDGNFEEALRLTQIELEKDPNNYEGLMLAATLCHMLDLPEKAIEHLDMILSNPEMTDSQRDVARTERAKCEAQLRHLQSKQTKPT